VRSSVGLRCSAVSRIVSGVDLIRGAATQPTRINNTARSQDPRPVAYIVRVRLSIKLGHSQLAKLLW